jgi:hypothetical protein
MTNSKCDLRDLFINITKLNLALISLNMIIVNMEIVAYFCIPLIKETEIEREAIVRPNNPFNLKSAININKI